MSGYRAAVIAARDEASSLRKSIQQMRGELNHLLASAFAPCDINGLTLTCDDGIVGAEAAQPEHDFDEEETEEDFEEKPKRSKKRGCRARASRAHKKASASSGGGKKRRRYTADKTSIRRIQTTEEERATMRRFGEHIGWVGGASSFYEDWLALPWAGKRYPHIKQAQLRNFISNHNPVRLARMGKVIQPSPTQRTAQMSPSDEDDTEEAEHTLKGHEEDAGGCKQATAACASKEMFNVSEGMNDNGDDDEGEEEEEEEDEDDEEGDDDDEEDQNEQEAAEEEEEEAEEEERDDGEDEDGEEYREHHFHHELHVLSHRHDEEKDDMPPARKYMRLVDQGDMRYPYDDMTGSPLVAAAAPAAAPFDELFLPPPPELLPPLSGMEGVCDDDVDEDRRANSATPPLPPTPPMPDDSVDRLRIKVS